MFTFKIPSSGDEIEVRRLTVKDQNILVDRKRVQEGSAIDEVLQSCILTPGFDVKELLMGDRTALLVYIRTITYGPDFVFKVSCEVCGTQFEWKEDLSALPVKYLDPPLPYGEERIIEVTPPVLGRKIKLRLLKGKDEKQLRKVVMANPESRFSSLLRFMTVGVEGHEGPLSAKFFETLDAGDFDYILSEWQKADCGVDTTIRVECPACGRAYDMDLPMDPGFFMPRSSRRGSSPVA